MTSTSSTTTTTMNENENPRSMPHTESVTGVAELDQRHVDDSTAKVEARVSPFEKLGYANVSSQGTILFATDDWFASADNLLKDTPPVFDPQAYCEQGKVMDGWETRRRRESGHDWCVIKLPARADIRGVEIDTAHFTGNNAPAISIEAADLTCAQETSMVMGFPGALERLLQGSIQGTGASPEQVQQAEHACRRFIEWRELLPQTPLQPGYEHSRMHYFPLVDDDDNECCLGITHVRVNYFPDGGVARLKLWGSTTQDKPLPLARPAYSPIRTGRTCTVVNHGSGAVMPSRQDFDYPELSAQENGGVGLTCSNKHYGDPWNLIQSTLGRDMGDGWETARHPDRPSILVRNPETNLVDSDLSDWCILKLACVAEEGIQRIILDMKHFRGNYPESVLVEGCYSQLDDAAVENSEGVMWFPLVHRGRMAPDSEHVFDRHQLANASEKVSHVRVSIFPDGGLSRVRVYGAGAALQ